MLMRRLLTVILSLVATQAAVAGFEEGDAAYKSGDYVTALREFQSLAKQGDADAQNYLGLMYDKGRGVQEDDVEAVKWFRLAAEQGDASAQYNLGVMYTNGEGVPKDDVTAARWYRLAAALSMDMLSNGERDDSFQIV
jgi:TPR repeat protein